jgi:hypothetical protein
MEVTPKFRPEGATFIFHENVWTYPRLADEAGRVTRGLVANGVLSSKLEISTQDLVRRASTNRPFGRSVG